MRSALPGLAMALAMVTQCPAMADDYLRQPAVDALHYRFRIEVVENSDALVGETLAVIRFTEQGLSRFWLDLVSRSPSSALGMTVNSVSSGGSPVAFEQTGERLWLALSDPPRPGERREFRIRYHGVPASGLNASSNPFGARMFVAENWPNKARQWLPVIDHPSDKATSEFVVTAPAQYQVVANGLRQEVTDLGDGRRTSRWSQSIPIPSWHNVVAIGRFQSVQGDRVHGIPVGTWTFPEHRSRAPAFNEELRKCLAFFTARIGAYPYEKLGAVETISAFDGMENASVIFFSDRAFDGRPPAQLVSHEVAHQWFGGSVSPSDWNDVWISEGFATYCALLYLESERGREVFVQRLLQSRDLVFAAEAAEPASTVVHANLKDIRRVINPIVYEKGAWTNGIKGIDSNPMTITS